MNANRRKLSFQLESLEDRNLLSSLPTAAALIQPMKAPKIVNTTVTGLITGTFHKTGSTVALDATGNLPVLGAMTMTGSYKLTEVGHSLKWKISAGTATVADSGGQIKVKFAGSGTGLIVFSFTTEGTITSGTGHFQGATGTFSTVGSSYFDSVHMTIRMTVKTKA